MELRLKSEEQEELLKRNDKLVYYLVNKLRISQEVAEYEDLCSIGRIGLLKAAITFDESKNIKFATYASRCINNEIFMYLRKVKLHTSEISLYERINIDEEGNELTWMDKIPSSEKDKDIIEKIIDKETFIRVISIILNLLGTRDRLVVLYRTLEIKQKEIEEKLKISQSYVSRLEKKLYKKIKLYITTEEQYREVFKVEVVENFYQISFEAKDIINFNKEDFSKKFYECLQKVTFDEESPYFKVNFTKERIIIKLPECLESICFIAQIIPEINEFSDICISEKNKVSKEKPKKDSKKAKSSKKGLIDEKVVESSLPKPIEVEKNLKQGESNESKQEKKSQIKQERANQVNQVKDYILSKDTFTIKELKQKFPNLSLSVIKNALYLSKAKGLIEFIGRGKFEVTKK